MAKIKELSRIARHKSLREKIRGTAERPRLVIHRSLKNIQLQLIDDTKSRTVFSMSTSGKEIKKKIPSGGNLKAAEIFGNLFAQEAKAKGVKSVVFDRGGYLYRGRIKVLADSLRKGGLDF